MESDETTLLKPKPFNHPLMDRLPPIPDNDRLETLTNLTMAGDTVAREILIQHFLLVAKRALGIILAIYPLHMRNLDDMVGEAALIVVTLVDQIHSGDLVYNDKLLNYVATVVLSRVNEMLSEGHVIRVPFTTQRRLWNTGKEPLVEISSEEISLIPSPPTATDFDVREALDVVICAPIERQIVDLREAGYSDLEISEVLGFTQQTVNLLRLNLYQRYLEAIQ
jgi:hypothetical protein